MLPCWQRHRNFLEVVMNGVIDKCVKIFSNVMEIQPDVISDESSPDNIEGWDSLAHVELISALEDEFSASGR